MKTSREGIDLIKKEEGFVPNAYLCPAGVWTIGYGHTRGVKQGDKISPYQGELYLREDLGIAEQAVNSQNLTINQNQFDALVSFAFNVGVAAFERSTLLKKIKQNPNDRASISAEFRKWKHGGGKVLPGLIKRRENEIAHYFKK